MPVAQRGLRSSRTGPAGRGLPPAIAGREPQQLPDGPAGRGLSAGTPADAEGAGAYRGFGVWKLRSSSAMRIVCSSTPALVTS